MVIVQPSITTRIPVRLTDGYGVAVTGRLPTDVQSGIATIVKGDGSTADLTLVGSGGGQNWYEVDGTKAPGLYHVVVPGSFFNVAGPTQLVVLPSAGAFVPVFDSFLVQSLGLDASAIATAVWDALRTDHVDVGTMGDLMRLLNLVLAGRVKIDATLGKQTLYAEDGTSIFQTQNLKNASGAAAGLDATERLAAVRG